MSHKKTYRKSFIVEEINSSEESGESVTITDSDSSDEIKEKKKRVSRELSNSKTLSRGPVNCRPMAVARIGRIAPSVTNIEAREFVYVYYSSSYKHLKIGRSNNKDTLKKRYSKYKTQDNAAMMIAFETTMCNAVEDYIRERILPSYRLNKEKAKKTDECYSISLFAARYVIAHTIAKIDLQISVETLVGINSELIEGLCKYSKDDPKTLEYDPENKISIVYLNDLTTTMGRPLVNINKEVDILVEEFKEVKVTSNEIIEKKPKEDDQDGIKLLISEKLIKSPKSNIGVSDLFICYEKFCVKKKLTALSRNAFSPAIKKELNINKFEKINKESFIVGYELK